MSHTSSTSFLLSVLFAIPEHRAQPVLCTHAQHKMLRASTL